MALVVLLSIELGVRAIFSVYVGPSVMLYGTRFARLSMDQTSESSQLLRVLSKRAMTGVDGEFHNVST